VQGGGSICASLDVAGARIIIDNPDAGSLEASNSDACLQNGSASLDAVVATAPYVPEGYNVAYVLTQGPGLVIVNAGAEPSFTVNAEGTYTIHTLVYDPNTLDLGIVQLGVTTGFDVNSLLIQGGGTICASLDVPGAAFTVTACNEPCIANAGTLSANTLENLCLEAGSATLAATPNGDAVVPDGYSLLYVLTSGPELTIQNVAPTPNFSVSSEGLYTIHTLVYDAATLDLSVVVPGQTTGVDVLNLVVENGICASLDVPGAPFFVEACAGNDIEVLGWPTIAKEEMWVSVSGAEQRVEMGVFTLRGEPVMPLRAVPSEESLQRLDLSDLAPGTYLLRVVSGDSVVVRRFVRAD